MKIITVLFLTVFLCQAMSVFGQEEVAIKAIAADSTWGREPFQFPLSFAPEIDFQGVEVALFPKGWGKIESPAFWSYAFVWEIDSDSLIAKSQLETSLQSYFEGLLGLDFLRKNDPSIQNTNAQLVKKTASVISIKYEGRIETFDNRIAKKPMILQVTIEQHYCQESNKATILFKFSPKTFDHSIWIKLAGVSLGKEVCGK